MEASAAVVPMTDALMSRQKICRCERKALRWGEKSNGAKYYKYQCLDCYKMGQEVAKINAKGNEARLVQVSYDEYNRPENRNERHIRFSEAWWRAHNAYLQTPKWRAKREAVMRRDENLCQACLSARASDVHHLTYDHHFDEPLFDLIAVCRPCHDRITAMDRAKRGA